jgi:hypothetical protein
MRRTAVAVLAILLATIAAPATADEPPRIHLDTTTVAVSEQPGVTATATDVVQARHRGAGLRIAVLDTGVATVGDLTVEPGADLIGGTDGTVDYHWTSHGTRVATIATSPTLGYCPGCTAVTVTVCDATGGCPAWIDGIRTATSLNVDVINMSFGTPTYSAKGHAAVRDAAAAGIVLVASAGNDGSRVEHYPAAYPEVISVGATDTSGKLADYSNRGRWVDTNGWGVAYSYSRDGHRGTLGRGTSWAAPSVAGIAALTLDAGAAPAAVLDAAPRSSRGQLVDATRMVWRATGIRF